MATATNVKLPELISRWIEMQKKGVGLERTEPLDIDAINLTLLLKTMGLRLQYLDFEADKSNADNLTVTIKCNRSGMRAELTYDLISCSCPAKTERESSFWEVQATGPKVFSKFKNNTSSNLLPDVSESCALVSKAMLSNLLDFYQANIRQVKEEKTMQHTPLKTPHPKVCVTSPGLTIQNPFSTPPAEGKCPSRMDSTIENDTFIEMENQEKHEMGFKQEKGDFKDELVQAISLNRRSSERPNELNSNSSAESGGINNKTHEIVNSECHTEKPVVDSVHSPGHTSVPDDNAFEAMKTLVTSSPNETRVQGTLHHVDLQHDRDLNVINCLQQARSQIDMALLLMKLNTTQDNPEGSALTVTPQHTTAISRKSFATPRFVQSRSNSLMSIERRRPPVDIGAKKKLSSNNSIGSNSKTTGAMTARRADTPRPPVKPVGTLRKTATMPTSGLLGTVGQPWSSAGKKPTTNSLPPTLSQRKLLPSTIPSSSGKYTPKPTTSGRSMSNLACGLIQRSSSASHIIKK